MEIGKIEKNNLWNKKSANFFVRLRFNSQRNKSKKTFILLLIEFHF